MYPSISYSDDDLSSWRLPLISSPLHDSYAIAQVKLGRQLFFDPRISGRHALSCASCHHPGLNWSDGMPLSLESLHGLGRHTPNLIYANKQTLFFWDGRAKTLASTIQQHLLNPGIMRAGSAVSLSQYLSTMSGYVQGFSSAFGNVNINIDQIVQSLAAFVNRIQPPRTPFQRWVYGEKEAIDVKAKAGFALFTGKAECIKCHQAPIFSDQKTHNLGLNSVDPGHFEISHLAKDHNSFKTPSLYQIAATAPYMHDGSKDSLQDVIAFYNRGGDRPNNSLQKLDLSEQEQYELLVFLRCLTGEIAQVTMPSLPASGNFP
ncbi:MAG: cytochrome c peroxidase [Mariprofundales bacterium]